LCCTGSHFYVIDNGESINGALSSQALAKGGTNPKQIEQIATVTDL
jgi:hypothetical protein